MSDVSQWRVFFRRVSHALIDGVCLATIYTALGFFVNVAGLGWAGTVQSWKMNADFWIRGYIFLVAVVGMICLFRAYWGAWRSQKW